MLREISIHRKLLLWAASVYLVWWGVVELSLPGSFNPLGSRLFVVGTLLAVCMASFKVTWIKRNMSWYLNASLWLMTLHYYYLFYGNNAGTDWIVGCFITVIAISLCVLSNRALLWYSVFVTVLSAILVALIPGLTHTVFLPGLVTVLLQANFGLRARFKLRESNERFQLLFHSTFEGVLVHRDRKILSVNRALEEMLGYSPGELLGKEATIIIAKDRLPEAIERMAYDDTSNYESVGAKKDGSRLDIEVRGKKFIYDGLPARLVTIQDIESKKRSESERLSAKTLAEGIRVREEFISMASHELRTPLTSLKLQTEFMTNKMKSGELQKNPMERITKYVQLVHRQTERLTKLVETMLDVSRISSGKMHLDQKQIDVIAVVREVVEFFKTQEVADRITLSIETPAQLLISADQYRMEQVIENLMTNALKYGDNKPVSLTVRNDNSHIFFFVKDNGIGIAPENMQRIFERFERANPTRSISGLGLGLYITRQIIEAHGGGISVESSLGKGSTFTVRLPIK